MTSQHQSRIAQVYPSRWGMRLVGFEPTTSGLKDPRYFPHPKSAVDH